MVQLTSLTPLLQVHDMLRAVAFYSGKLGFEVVRHSPEVETGVGRLFHWCRLRRDGAQLMLNTAYDRGEGPPERDEARWAGHGHTVLFINCPELDELSAELRAKGLEVTGPHTADYGMRQVEVTDPDGYEICFQCPA
jgi:catechol 2,3-dioxygenase-like lactoylglutathione lyase family enzyme